MKKTLILLEFFNLLTFDNLNVILIKNTERQVDKMTVYFNRFSELHIESDVVLSLI